MRPVALPAVLAVAVLLLSGCNGPRDATPTQDPTVSVAPAPTYDVRVVVTQETPSGAALQAEVQGFVLGSDGKVGPAMVRSTSRDGAAVFSFKQPTTLLVRAIGPAGWTKEGTRIHVDTAVAAAGLTVSDRDVFLPLYHSTLSFTAQHEWSTVTGGFLQPDGRLAAALTVVPLDLPAGLGEAYLSRLNDAYVTATWTDGLDGRAATVAAGLAWDGVAWTEGPEASAATATGQRSAVWDADLPGDRPDDLATAHLQAALFTRTAIVGDVLFGVTTELRFGGQQPSGLPKDECHGALLC